jgi:hypothetical protein
MASRRARNSADTFSLNAAKMIDAAFARPVTITYQGKKVRVSTYLAIVLQLSQKAFKDRRALRVLSRYTAYAASHGGVRKLRIEYSDE